MAGRGAQTFKKRQKEQQRKERQEEKRAKRLERKNSPDEATTPSDDPHQDPDIAFDLQVALPPGATRSWTE